VESGKDNFDLMGLERCLPGEKLSGGDLITEIGRLFVGRPYRAGTLDQPGREKLLVNFFQFDCTTFVETVLALARSLAKGPLTAGKFRRELQLIRYRRGMLDGYSSRLHYFTDWLSDNEKKKVLENISHLLAGRPLHKKINYMTTHRESYPGLKNDTEAQKIRRVEKNLSRKVLRIISPDEIGRQKVKIKNGDIIAFASSQEGLDIAHTGFALWQGRWLHLLHASSKEGAVIISKKTLSAYLKSNKKFTGIIVARVK